MMNDELTCISTSGGTWKLKDCLDRFVTQMNVDADSGRLNWTILATPKHVGRRRILITVELPEESSQ